MGKLLVVNSSPNFETSASRQLTAEFAKSWQGLSVNNSVKERDVAKYSIPHLDQETIGAFYTPAENRTAEQKLAVALSDTLVDEMLDADTVVIGAAMHNFSITAGLKSYFDQIARVGRTFNYTENGPVGVLGDKKFYIIAASGGKYSEGNPAQAMNMLEPLIRTFLGFLGAKDITFIYGEGLAMGDDVRAKSIQAATSQIANALVQNAA